MTKTTTISGLSLAVAAAALFLGAPIANAGQTATAKTGHCMGATASKGHGACKSAATACKGQHACKGQGFTETSAKDCQVAGGKFEVPKPVKPEAKKA